MPKQKKDEIELNDGLVPSSGRSCHDLFFLLLFLLFWVGMGFIGWQAVILGDPKLLVYPTDSNGFNCGLENSKTNGPDLREMPFLYFTNPFDSKAIQVCVKECPSSTSVPATVQNAICEDRQKPSSTSNLATLIKAQKCSSFVYASSPILYRCFPTNATDLQNGATSSDNSLSITDDAVNSILQGQDLAQQIVADFSRTWIWFLAFAGGATVISFLWLIVLRFFAGFFVWSVILIGTLAINGLAVFLYFAWNNAIQENKSFNYKTTSMQREEDTFMGMFIAAVIIAVIIDLVLLVLRSRLRISIRVIKEASVAVRSMPLLLFFPLFVFVVMLILLAYWVLIELFLASAIGQPKVFDQSYPLEIFKYFQWYHLFGLFWGQQFLSGINQTVIAGSIATWYWSADKKALPRNPVAKAFGRTIRYNLGSIALGSLIIAVIQMIRVVLFTIERQLKGKTNKFTKTLLACCQCCFACIEKLFKFINKNAYIEIAIFGGSFCKSAKNAFQLLIRNAFRLIAIDAVSSFILFLSKFAVASICAAGSYYIMRWYYTDNPLNYVAASVFVIVIIGYVVSSMFLYVYDMAIDTIFLCFCEDCERNDGSAERPYRMSKALQGLANVKTGTKPVPKNKVAPEPPSSSKSDKPTKKGNQQTKTAFYDED